MAKWWISCYRARPMCERSAVRASNTVRGVVLLASLCAVSQLRAEPMFVLQPPAWPAASVGSEEERPRTGESSAPPAWFLTIAERALRGLLQRQDRQSCPLGGEIGVACRENGNGSVLLAEAASCRLRLTDDREISATGEFALELPAGMGCSGTIAPTCMAAVVRGARLLASVADRRRGGVETTEVRQSGHQESRWLVPCPTAAEGAVSRPSPQESSERSAPQVEDGGRRFDGGREELGLSKATHDWDVDPVLACAVVPR